jgi:predicted CoA-binding protein
MNINNNISVVSIFPTPMKKKYVISNLISKKSYTE